MPETPEAADAHSVEDARAHDAAHAAADATHDAAHAAADATHDAAHAAADASPTAVVAAPLTIEDHEAKHLDGLKGPKRLGAMFALAATRRLHRFANGKPLTEAEFAAAHDKASKLVFG